MTRPQGVRDGCDCFAPPLAKPDEAELLCQFRDSAVDVTVWEQLQPREEKRRDRTRRGRIGRVIERVG